VKLWGRGIGSNNGLTLSADGGAFVGADPGFENGTVSQTLTGLTVGKALTVTFDYAGDYAGAQWADQRGWAVSLGAETFDTTW
jgi:hypothetical protein